MSDISKVNDYLQQIQKQLNKGGKQQQILQQLDTVVLELCGQLQVKDLNEHSSAIQKIFTMCKEMLNMKIINTTQQEQPQIHIPPKGDQGRFGGVKVLKSADEPVKFQLEDNQKDLLSEVLRQKNNLNVQIVMKRYDPKIKLFITQGTDTNQDVFDAMRMFSRDDHENQINFLSLEADFNIQEIQKTLQDKQSYQHLQTSGSVDKLKNISRSLIQKTQDVELALNDAQRDQFDSNLNVDDFIKYINLQYKEVQDETYKIVMRVMSDYLKKSKLEWSKKQEQALQSSTKKDKRSIQKQVEDAYEKHRHELDKKNKELEKLQQDIKDLHQILRERDDQIITLQIQLEQLQLIEQKTNLDKAQIQFEKQKLEKQLTVFISKITQDEAIQVTDNYSQTQITKLSSENVELTKKISLLLSEVKKSQKILQEQKSQIDQYEKSKDEQGFSDGQSNILKKLTSNEFDNKSQMQDNDLISIAGSSRNINLPTHQKQSTSRYIDKSLVQGISQQSSRNKLKQKSQYNINATSKITSPKSELEDISPRSQKKSQRQSITKIKLQKSIGEEDSASQYNRKITKPSNTFYQGSKKLTNNQKPPDVELTQAGTIIETHRTGSGRMIMTERTKSGKFNKIEQSPSGRRIQTETFGDSEEFQYVSLDQKTNIKLTRGQTQKDIHRVKRKSQINRGYTEAMLEDYDNEQQSKYYKKVDFQDLDQSQEIEQTNQTNHSQLQKMKSTPNLFKERNNQTFRRTSSSGQEQEIQMAIQVNSEEKIHYTTIWKPRFKEQEVQTEYELLVDLIENMLVQMDIPTDKLQSQLKILRQGIQKIDNKQSVFSFFNQVNNIPLGDFNNNPNQKRESQHSQPKSNHTQSLKVLDIDDIGTRQKSDMESSRSKTRIIKTKEQILLDQQKLKEQTQQSKDQILMMRETYPTEEEHLTYDELVRKVQKEENNGQPLEQLKVLDLKNEKTQDRFYKAFNTRKTKGTNQTQEILRRYYNKSPNDMITQIEFKNFYQKLSAVHKQCGQTQMCQHLIRFIMRLGFTSAIFARRQILKPSLQTVKPFTPPTPQMSYSQIQREQSPHYFISKVN